MGAVFGIPQPTLKINVIGRAYCLTRDDPVTKLPKGTRVVFDDYFVSHGMSSQTVHHLELKCSTYNVAFPVNVYPSQTENPYFTCERYDAPYSADRYRGKRFTVKLKPTNMLRSCGPRRRRYGGKAVAR
jgi:hypothetical protein